ncbi:hypothetical protein, partial [Photobacterium sp. R1]
AVQAKVELSMFLGNACVRLPLTCRGFFSPQSFPAHTPLLSLVSGSAMYRASSYIYVNTDCRKAPDE